jgi:large subunit ribosomal protein L27e
MFLQTIRRTQFDTTKVVNYSHLFPTRYSVELEGLKGILSAESFKEPTQREDSKKQVKKLLEERYTSGKNKWFFQALRVCDHYSCTRRSRQQYVQF